MFQLFDKCLAPDTHGDGTGCDNMTCVIVQFLGGRQNGEPVKRTGSPVEIEAKRAKVDSESNWKISVYICSFSSK